MAYQERIGTFLYRIDSANDMNRWRSWWLMGGFWTEPKP